MKIQEPGGAGGGGSGTVTSLSASTGITLNPNPITTTGTIGLTVPVVISSGGTNSTTALSGSSIMISNGTSIIQGSAGTTTTVLHGNASGAPTYGAVVLTTDVSGILPVANGGSGTSTAFTQGSVIFAGASGVYSQDNTNFNYDGTNHVLQIASPTANINPLTIAASTSSFGIGLNNDNGINFKDTGGTSRTVLWVKTDNTVQFRNNALGTGNDITFFNGSTQTAVFRNGGNVGIGTITAPAWQLHVNGTGQTGTTITDAGATTGSVMIASTSNSANAGGALLFSALLDNSTYKNQAGIKTVLTGGTSNGSSDLVFYLRSGAGSTVLTEMLRITNTGNISATSKITTYNSLATAGSGVSVIYASYSQTGKTAAVTNAINYTPPATAGRYRLSWTVNVTTSTAYSFNVVATWKDDSGNAISQSLGGFSPAANALATGSITNVIGSGVYYGEAIFAIDNSATAITLSTSGTFTTVTYNLSSTLEQLA